MVQTYKSRRGQTYQNESSVHANTVANVYIMSRHLQPYIPILKKITCMREAKRRAYLKDCDCDIIDCFSECAKNVLNNNAALKKRSVRSVEEEEEGGRAKVDTSEDDDVAKATNLTSEGRLCNTDKGTDFLNAMFQRMLAIGTARKTKTSKRASSNISIAC